MIEEKLIEKIIKQQLTQIDRINAFEEDPLKRFG